VAARWAALQPLAVLHCGASQPGDPGGVTLHLLHRYSALATLLCAGHGGSAGAVADEAAAAGGRLLLVLLSPNVALGSLTVLSGFSLWLAISHGVCCGGTAGDRGNAAPTVSPSPQQAVPAPEESVPARPAVPPAAFTYTENDEPQPQVDDALGFLITNCEPSSPSV
jgi:hypothetical protein